MSAILKFDFQKKKTITFFWSKLSKLHKKRPNFECDNYIFPKTREIKNKQCTHSTPLNQDSHTFSGGPWRAKETSKLDAKGPINIISQYVSMYFETDQGPRIDVGKLDLAHGPPSENPWIKWDSLLSTTA